jgi:4,5-dihydroxyphthalate decarboxylase
MSKKLRLSLGCWNYDRTRALQDGRVQPDGIDLTYLDMPVEETFFRMLRHQEFDVAELSLSSYAVSLFKEKKNFIAIPVFPSRFFRHSCIYVNAKSGIREPRDLIGRKIGNTEYQMTRQSGSAASCRRVRRVGGFVTYHTGGEEPNRREAQARPPPNIRVKPIGGRTRWPRCCATAASTRSTPRACLHVPLGRGGEAPLRELHGGGAGLLQEDPIFPIMHMVAIKRSVYEKNPWVAMSLYKAFVQAQRHTYDDLYVTAALKTMLPWLTKHVEDARALMGDDFWPYGFEPNRKTLETFLRYHHEQGLSKTLLKPEELFAPETLESFKI